MKGYLNRYRLLFHLSSYDHIYVHREFGPMGPPLLAWICSRLLKRPFIFDFDDAIWLPNHSDSNRIYKFLKPPANALKLMKWSKVNVCGNSYLQDKAKTQNSDSILIPTTIDTVHRHNQINEHNNEVPVIGWTGSHSTIKYLDEVIPVLKELEKVHDFRFRVISDVDPGIQLSKFEFIRWNKKTEIEDLSAIDIGLMPLPENKWTKGKCGLKALQYMALGSPVLLSPVGMNKELIEDGVQGYFCSGPQAWKDRLDLLLKDRNKLKQMGSQTRSIVERQFSIQSNRSKFLLLFA